MSTRGPEPATATWSGGAAAAPGMDRIPDHMGRHSERHVPIEGDVMQRERLQPDGGTSLYRDATDLRALARGAVRAALLAEQRGVGLDGEVRHFFHVICVVARAHGTPVERVLILIKEAWREQPEARPRRYADAEDSLARVITVCIEEYYARTGVA